MRWLSALLVLCTCAQTCLGAQYLRPANCTTDCDSVHTCVTNLCHTAWDGCGESPWLVETRRTTVTDDNDCYDNGCSLGGCGEAGFAETSSQTCIDIRAGCVPCQRETCCRVRTQVTCCQRITCTVHLEGCQVPQQRSLVYTNTSAVYTIDISDGSSVSFPFFRSKAVPADMSCESARVWGACSCADGTLVPGCQFNDSSTWKALGSEQLLPPRLSLTCVVLPPLPSGAPPAVTPAGAPAAPDSQGHSRLSGLAVAGIVVASLTGAVALAVGAAAVVARRSARAQQWASVQSAYQPVVTGQVVLPGMGTHRLSTGTNGHTVAEAQGITGQPQRQQLFSRFRQWTRGALGRGWSPLSQQPGSSRGHVDGDEAEGLYTLEDLDLLHAGSRRSEASQHTQSPLLSAHAWRSPPGQREDAMELPSMSGTGSAARVSHWPASTSTATASKAQTSSSGSHAKQGVIETRSVALPAPRLAAGAGLAGTAVQQPVDPGLGQVQQAHSNSAGGAG